MDTPNPLREALEGGRFCYVVELVASRLTREARLLEVASQLARVPGVVAGSITSYAGGAMGHDPIRVGTAARARGLTPNIHLTCVNRDVAAAQRALEDLHALGIENVFALTGDYPKSAGPQQEKPLFDLDSVQLVRMIAAMRERGIPFWIAVAVSPFKYTEADCAYQYLKLEKKFAAGADYAVTQLGYDARKFRELRSYLDERGIRKPVLGSVYVLAPKAAEKMSKGEPPGCWVAPELLEKIREEAKAPDKGAAARLERAARMVAIVRGLGYAGAYLGGDHQADHIRWIIKRSEAIANRWEEFAEELNYAPKSGFYLRAASKPEARKRGAIPAILDALGKAFPVNRDTALRRSLARVFGWVDRHPVAAHGLERLEFALKRPLFGCEACGNCVLGHMEYVCPQTCPKHLRNGPCGGTLLERCEVVDQPCIWVAVYEHAAAAARIEDLKTFIPPPDRTLTGTSSWINYFLGRDNRPGSEHPLVTIRGIQSASRTVDPAAGGVESKSAAAPHQASR
jgi:methylenetetrahydrofolate reductase (NADPH)